MNIFTRTPHVSPLTMNNQVRRRLEDITNTAKGRPSKKGSEVEPGHVTNDSELYILDVVQDSDSMIYSDLQIEWK
jgi:hypothetical protein